MECNTLQVQDTIWKIWPAAMFRSRFIFKSIKTRPWETTWHFC